MGNRYRHNLMWIKHVKIHLWFTFNDIVMKFISQHTLSKSSWMVLQENNIKCMNHFPDAYVLLVDITHPDDKEIIYYKEICSPAINELVDNMKV